MPEDYDAFIARVRRLVERYTLGGPLPTWFEVHPEELQRGAIVRAKMGRIHSRAPVNHANPHLITTTAREVIPVGSTDDDIARMLYEFARGIYDHEFHEWFRRDGELVADPHAEDGA